MSSVNAYAWHQPLWQRFYQAQAAHRLPHAILLHGARGLGKMVFAKQMIQALLCERAGQACGECRSCHLWQLGNHPDFYALQPEESHKAIKVDAVREALAWLPLTAQGTRKVLLIAPVEAMNVAASNALLKSLEEPNSHTLLVLVSHQLSLVLPTLRSRCQLWAMPWPTAEERRHYLRQHQLDDGVVDEGPLLAVERHQTGQVQQRQAVLDAIQAYLQGATTLAKVSALIQKCPMPDGLLWLMQYWQQQMVAHLHQPQVDMEEYVNAWHLMQRLKAWYEQGANLNWPLQWEALLCQLKGKTR